MSVEHSRFREGCLSIPGFMSEVERPAEVEVAFLTIDGEEQRLKAEGLLATCLQHEIDHLNGVLFIDRLPAGVEHPSADHAIEAKPSEPPSAA